MQIVIKRRRLHPESLAAHQARRRVRDSRCVIPAGSIAQRADVAGQPSAVAISIRHCPVGRISLHQRMPRQIVRPRRGVTRPRAAAVQKVLCLAGDAPHRVVTGQVVVRVLQFLACAVGVILIVPGHALAELAGAVLS